MIPPKKMASRSALAYTLGIDPAELSDYRYHAGRTPFAVYAIGETYLCSRSTPPQFGPHIPLGMLVWARHPDQFWAEKAGTVIWTALASSFAPQ